MRKTKATNWKLTGSFISAALLGTGMLVLVFVIDADSQQRAMNLMLMILGASVGWIVGILISPYTSGEKTQFERYAKVIGTFASGYGLAKVGPWIDDIIAQPEPLTAAFWFPAMLALASLLIVTVVVYVARQYG